MKNIVKTILGIGTSVLLVFVIIMEVKIGFNMLDKNMDNTDTQLIAYAKELGSKVSVTELHTYDEAPCPDVYGDVFAISGYSNIRVKINGVLTSTSPDFYGSYTYSSINDNASESVNVSHMQSGYETFRNAYIDYLNGVPESLLDSYGFPYREENITYYQQSYADYVVPVIFNDATKLYYMFIDTDDETFFVITCKEPISLTKEKATVHYGDPAKNVMLYHTYSKYEEWAAEKQLLALEDTDKNKNTSGVNTDNNPYTSGDVVGTSETYTSSSDNSKRALMATYGNYTWKADGTSDQTSTILDISSDSAKKSEWNIKSTSYSYSVAGLSIIKLSARAENGTFSLTVYVNNTLAAERPYVAVIKYLDASGNLIGVKAVDKRSTPIEANGVDNFTVDINSTTDNCKIEDINSIQFEIY